VAAQWKRSGCAAARGVKTTLMSEQPGAAWSGQEVCSGFALAARARGSLYEFVLYNSFKKCMNWYKNHTVYEFVLHDLYNNCMNSFV
jgi:hypothetical protein